MRNISFSLTTEQFKARTKTVTRRLGWLFLIEGDELMACEKCMGLKKGEQIVRLGRIRVVSVQRNALWRLKAYRAYGTAEAEREGFPDLTGAMFVALFCKHMKCTPETIVTRIEFEYLDKEQS